MIRLGIIGTSSIAHEFATAAKASGQFEIKAVYSRTQFNAQSFGEGYGADLFVTELDKFTALEEVDAFAELPLRDPLRNSTHPVSQLVYSALPPEFLAAPVEGAAFFLKFYLRGLSAKCGLSLVNCGDETQSFGRIGESIKLVRAKLTTDGL